MQIGGSPFASPAPPSGEIDEQVVWASYWTVERGFHSTLEMKNNLLEQSLTARVGLYFTSGEVRYLPPIDMGPRQTATLDLNRAVADLFGRRLRSGLTEGRLEVRFYAHGPAALMGAVSVVDSDWGTAWNFFMYPVPQDVPPVPVQGLF
jgi:hypothetical protein